MLPFETILAIFPSLGTHVPEFNPVTCAHLAAMEALGIDLDYDVSATGALVAAWVLTHPATAITRLLADGNRRERNFNQWVRRKRFWLALRGRDLEPDDIADKVNRHLHTAFTTLIKGADNATTKTCMRSGLGYPLELAEWYAHEYSATFDEALCVPVVHILALIACARQRNGGKHGGADYFERIDLRSDSAVLSRLKSLNKANEKDV